MTRTLYSLLLRLSLPALLLRLLWRSRRQPAYRRHWAERLGYFRRRPTSAKPLIWIHAVSVGETRAAEPLLALLRTHHPELAILLSHTTPTGRATGEDLFGGDIDIERVYLPYDTAAAMRRFLGHFRPLLGVLMETEIWPNLIAVCREQGLPLLLANARLSARSAQRYARLPALTEPAVRGLVDIAAQSEEDAARLRQLGATRVRVSGNLKFDSAPAAALIERGRAWRRAWGSRPVLLAASTREGEEALILAALRRRPIAGLLLVLVPRHPQRFDAVTALARNLDFQVARRSAGTEVSSGVEVLIGDSMGEMPAYYASCDLALIGGSLLDFGCQNLIEACAVGAPVLLGPSTYNFAGAAQAALACAAARQAADADALLGVAAALLADESGRQRMSEAGLAFTASHRGASARTLAMIEAYLGLGPSRIVG